jgi:hypothetical protein
MPYQLTRDTTPLGVPILRNVSHGRVTAAEAADLLKDLGPGGPFHGLPMLVLTEVVDVSPEARRVFTQTAGDKAGPPVAIVSKSTVLRVTVNFISRINGAANLRFFASEADALCWLDEVCVAPGKERKP